MTPSNHALAVVYTSLVPRLSWGRGLKREPGNDCVHMRQPYQQNMVSPFSGENKPAGDGV